MTIDTQDTCVPTRAQKTASSISPVERHLALALIVTGIAVITLGIIDDSTAQVSSGAIIDYDTGPRSNLTNAIWTYIEHSGGALIMASAGLAAILCAVFRKWKAATILLLIAGAVFIGRCLVGTFFNDVGIQE